MQDFWADESSSVISLAPSDASHNIAAEELSLITHMISQKIQEVDTREQFLCNYGAKLNADILKAQNMLESLALTLTAEAETRLTVRTESLTKRITAALDSADLRVANKRQTKETVALLEAKHCSLEENLKESKIKHQHTKTQLEQHKQLVSTLQHENEQLKAKLDLCVVVPSKKASTHTQTDTLPPPPPPPPPVVIEATPIPLALFGKFPDFGHADIAAQLATRMLLETTEIPMEFTDFAVNVLFARLCLMLRSAGLQFPEMFPENQADQNLLSRTRMEILRKRLATGNIAEAIDGQMTYLQECHIGAIAMQSQKASTEPAVHGRVALFSCPVVQAKIVTRIKSSNFRSPKTATLLFALTRGPLDASSGALEEAECVRCVLLIDADAAKLGMAARHHLVEAVRGHEYIIHRLFEASLRGNHIAATLLADVANSKHKVWMQTLLDQINLHEKSGERLVVSDLKKIVKALRN